MSLIQIYLICFAAGTVIHGAYAVLVLRLWWSKKETDRLHGTEGLPLAVVTFLWQFGNLATAVSAGLGWRETTIPYEAASLTRNAALLSFPLLFSSICRQMDGVRHWLIRFGRALWYPLWVWTAAAVAVRFAGAMGWRSWLESASLNVFASLGSELDLAVTLHLMLVYFVIFTVAEASNWTAISARTKAGTRARKASIVAAALGAAMFIMLLGFNGQESFAVLRYMELAAMMTSVPFTLSGAYRLYQFPFMDAFIREVISGSLLFAAFSTAVAAWLQLPPAFSVLWIAATGIALLYTKEPVTRWVEKRFMGYEESVEQQEERIGETIRSLSQLNEFEALAAEIVRKELEADWVEVGASRRNGAVHQFDTLRLGPRIGGRHYMSRELRVARTAALQIAAQRHQLRQQELRELTSVAQMRALKAQINPHFLFNALNVLANLIHSNPQKAERVTEELAEIFRYALESTRLEWVKLADELDFLSAYLDIEKARFEERLTYSFAVDEEARSLKIPPMILQPIVENAIRHGISPKMDGGEVRIRAGLELGILTIIVEDTGIGPSVRSRHDGAGVGLTNVRERLKHLYGDSASLRLEQLSPEGTRAVLVLPALVGVHS